MVHVAKRQSVAGLQRLRKVPVAYEVSAQAGVSAQTVGMPFGITEMMVAGAEVCVLFFRKSLGDDWFVGHFQTVGHMACE